MVTLIQRLLQLLVLVGLAYFIVKPQVLPQPAQRMAYGAQRFIFGAEVSWPSFVSNWQEKWRYITTTVPVIGSWAAMVAPEPQTITPDMVMNTIIRTILVQPMEKWNSIKRQYIFPDPSPDDIQVATASAEELVSTSSAQKE